MKRNIILSIIIISIYSCQEHNDLPHKGTISNESYSIEIDTLMIPIDQASGYGNYYMMDSTITFVDAITCTFYDLDLNGHIIDHYFRKGNGKNEMPSLLYSYPIENDSLHRSVIIDNSNGVTIFDRRSKTILSKRIADFGWTAKASKNYKSTNIYNFSFFTDFGVSFYLDSDSTIIFQANIINRNTRTPEDIENNRYTDGAILGKLDLSTMKVVNMFGHYPEIYQSHPTPHLEFFQYAITEDKMYVNHTVDSLIYVYQLPDKLLYTMGYECKGIDRNYSVSRIINNSALFKKDLQHVGFNTGLRFIPDSDILCRTYIKSAKTGESGMQIYKNYNLVADIAVPSFFNFLGYYDEYYYGSRYIPLENDEITTIVIYRLKIKFNDL